MADHSVVWMMADVAESDIGRTCTARDVAMGRERKNKKALTKPEALELFCELEELRH